MSGLEPLLLGTAAAAPVASVAVPAGIFSTAGGAALAAGVAAPVISAAAVPVLAGTAATAGILGAGGTFGGSIGGGLSAGQMLGLAGSAISAIGNVQEGNARASAAQYNAQLARQNAILSRQASAENERRFRVNTKKQLGSIKAGYAKSGVTLEGTPSDILEESSYIAELDALTIRNEGRRTAGAYESESRLSKRAGKVARRSGYYGAASSLLKGGANLYANWPV